MQTRSTDGSVCHLAPGANFVTPACISFPSISSSSVLTINRTFLTGAGVKASWAFRTDAPSTPTKIDTVRFKPNLQLPPEFGKLADNTLLPLVPVK